MTAARARRPALAVSIPIDDLEALVLQQDAITWDTLLELERTYRRRRGDQLRVLRAASWEEELEEIRQAVRARLGVDVLGQVLGCDGDEPW